MRQLAAAGLQRLRELPARFDRLFALIVLLPTALAALYFGLIASDVYISESRFVVRNPEHQVASPLGLLLNGTGFSRSQDESYAIQDFALSRDALATLDASLGLRKAYASHHIDRISRFAGLDGDYSFEALYRYYRKKTDIQLDSLSSITILTVRAFKADDAFRVNEQLLEMSEGLVNKLNESGRQDLIRFAVTEVEQAEVKANQAAQSLSGYRNQNSVADPERQFAIQLQGVAKLQDDLIATRSQLQRLVSLTKNNPQIPALQKQVDILRADIKSETNRVAGGGASLSSKAVEYQRLALEREFADKQLAGAMASLELARNDAQRKQLYLERIVQPNRPDAAVEPRGLRSVLAVFVLGLVGWGIMAMLTASIREHQD